MSPLQINNSIPLTLSLSLLWNNYTITTITKILQNNKVNPKIIFKFHQKITIFHVFLVKFDDSPLVESVQIFQDFVNTIT